MWEERPLTIGEAIEKGYMKPEEAPGANLNELSDIVIRYEVKTPRKGRKNNKKQ